MTKSQALEPHQLRPKCDPDLFTFETSNDLDILEGIVSQERVLEAVDFGIGMQHSGYNLYVSGPTGIGKYSAITQVLKEKAARLPAPSDWCYVNNFEAPQKPKALQLPSGTAREFRHDIEQLIDELRTSIPAAFDSEAYRSRLSEIKEERKEQRDQAFEKLQEEADAAGLAVLNTPHGFGFAPIKNDEIITPEAFDKLSKKEQQKIEDNIEILQEKLALILRNIPRWQSEEKSKTHDLNKETVTFVTKHLIDNLREKYFELENILNHITNIQADIVENFEEFQKEQGQDISIIGLTTRPSHFFRRYEVNVLVENNIDNGVPVVYADNPTYQNLIGRVEYQSDLGALVTDFTQIRPGALHNANAGYLILDTHKVLLEPYAWQGLKRILNSQKITIESLGQMLGLISTVSLEPEPIPLDIKVILLGDQFLYYLLCEWDTDFRELFKVIAEFEDKIERNPENNQLYSQLLATLIKKHKLRPFNKSSIAEIIDHSARLADDGKKLSIHMRHVVDLLREADYWADHENQEIVDALHVKQAIVKQTHRMDRIRQRIYEQIDRKTILIDTDGEHIGQVNGLSVLQVGDFRFGQPSRITSTTRLGKGEVIDIEREVELGGAIHSKGVLILSSFLGARYANNQPLSLSASVVFEQTYGLVEGDSASLAELCALLSSLADIRIKQSLAVTGSVNQHGKVQAIGGVNEKIEGFFDICNNNSLTGQQGVLIPVSNVQHLMLRQDVVDAAANGQFHIYPINTIDEAISLLSGIDAGERNADGKFPDNTVNYLVEKKLQEYTEQQKLFAEPQARIITNG